MVVRIPQIKQLYSNEHNAQPFNNKSIKLDGLL